MTWFPRVTQLKGKARRAKSWSPRVRKVCRRPTPSPLPGRPRPPYLARTDHLLGGVDGLATAGTALGAADLLGKLGCVGVGGGPVARGPARGKGDVAHTENTMGPDRAGTTPPSSHNGGSGQLSEPVIGPGLPGTLGWSPISEMEKPRLPTVSLPWKYPMALSRLVTCWNRLTPHC